MQVDKHNSQKDYKTGFGGKFGVQSDRVDKSAVGWEHVEKVDKHNSQKGESALDPSPVSVLSVHRVSMSFQIIKKASVEVSESRQTEWTSPLMGGNTTRRLINTSHRKVKRRPEKRRYIVSYILCIVALSRL